MNRTLILLATTTALSACAGANKALVLKGDARAIGGSESVAKLELPGEWVVTSKKADKIEAAAPDNFSKVSMTIAPALVGPEACAELAARIAGEVALSAAGGNKDVKPELAPAGSPEVVGFVETVPASPPGPADRYVQGRIACRAGALVTVQCSTGISRQNTTGADCKKALDGLSVDAPAAKP